jgi:hypothetical protein
LQVATKCDLIIWSGAVPVTVAKGLVIPGQTLVHHAPVGRGYACVQIDSVVSEWRRIPLPVPTEDMLVVDDIRESFIQWPKNQIILDQVISKLSISLVTFKTALFKYSKFLNFDACVGGQFITGTGGEWDGPHD